jgi:hypothetical protein
MTGSWVFLAKGFDGANPMAIGAVFTVDGSAGLITSGTMDINVAGSAPQTNLTVNPSGSTYSVDPNGLVCIGLATMTGTTQGPTKIFHGALASYVNNLYTEGQIVEYDDTLGTGGRALGLLKQQVPPPSPTAWSTASLSAGYVFGLSGWNAAGGHVSAAGKVAFDGKGNLVNGLADANDAGALTAAQPFTGTYSLDSTGRGTVSFAVGNSTVTVNGVIYLVDSGQLTRPGEMFLLSTSWVGA